MKCFLVYRTSDGFETVEIDTAADIKFLNGGMVEYETTTEIVQDETKNLVYIYFTKTEG